MIIGDTPAQLGSCLTADAMLIDGKIVTRDDYLALAAQVGALHRALAALSVQAESALQEDIFCHSALKRAQREADEVLAATPQQHLLERDGQKGRAGFLAGVEARRIALLNDEQVAIKANQSADSIRQGKVGL